MNMKRMRGRSHRSSGGGGGGGSPRQYGGNIPLNRNHVFDSSGPDLRIRGTAQQLFEKYLQLGRDATGSGDRVMAESYFQYAEHYFRILNAINQASQTQGQQGQPQHGQPQNGQSQHGQPQHGQSQSGQPPSGQGQPNGAPNGQYGHQGQPANGHAAGPHNGQRRERDDDADPTSAGDPAQGYGDQPDPALAEEGLN